MRILLAFFILATAACTRDEKFLEVVNNDSRKRFTKNYKFQTNTSEQTGTDVDILWVIDNSGSMKNYQAAVKNNSAEFIRQFSSSTKLRWKMGLISTSYHEEPYMGFYTIVDYQTNDAILQFNEAVNRLGVQGDANRERTFEPVVKVLDNFPTFLRPNAFLIIVTVSDEVEQSVMTPSQFAANMIARLGGDKRKFGLFGVFSDYSNDAFNKRYDEIVKLSGGKSYRIDSPDYGVLLSEMGRDLVLRTTTVNPVVILDQKPDPQSLIVTYKGRVLTPGPLDQGGEWTFEPKFNFIQINDPKIIDNSVLDVTVSYELAR